VQNTDKERITGDRKKKRWLTEGHQHVSMGYVGFALELSCRIRPSVRFEGGQHLEYKLPSTECKVCTNCTYSKVGFYSAGYPHTLRSYTSLLPYKEIVSWESLSLLLGENLWRNVKCAHTVQQGGIHTLRSCTSLLLPYKEIVSWECLNLLLEKIFCGCKVCTYSKVGFHSGEIFWFSGFSRAANLCKALIDRLSLTWGWP